MKGEVKRITKKSNTVATLTAGAGQIELDSVERVEEEEAQGEKNKKGEGEKKKKISPKIFLKQKATTAMNKLKGSRDDVASHTRTALQPVAARTRSKQAAAPKPRYK